MTFKPNLNQGVVACTVMVSLVPIARLRIVQSTEVVTPVAGAMVQLEFGPIELVTSRFFGKTSTTSVASSGPALATLIV